MHTFAKAGKYKMWIDVKPKDGMQQILTAFAFNVEGQLFILRLLLRMSKPA
jgi:hypothetical protein